MVNKDLTKTPAGEKPVTNADARAIMRRSPALTQFFEAAHRALLQCGGDDAPMLAATKRIFTALRSPGAAAAIAEREQLETCRYLSHALDNARRGPAPVLALANAFEALEPSLTWWRRSGAEAHAEPFASGHANTYIAGPSGVERRSDVIIGASLVAPDVDYPQHAHGPEELYIVMSESDWYNEHAGWYTPGVGAVVYHAPGVRHAMRSRSQPLLAIWCLWAPHEPMSNRAASPSATARPLTVGTRR